MGGFTRSFGALQLDMRGELAAVALLVLGVSLGEFCRLLKRVGHLPVERGAPRSLTSDAELN